MARHSAFCLQWLLFAALCALLALAPAAEAARLRHEQSGLGGIWGGDDQHQARDYWKKSGKKHRSICYDKQFRKRSLKHIRTMPFIGLFEDTRGQIKFEASGTTIANGSFWAVFDNLHAIAKIEDHFEYRDSSNVLYGHLGDDSQFEGLAYDKEANKFLVVRESDEHELGLRPFIEEIAINQENNTYSVMKDCPVHFHITHANKGFEGLHYYKVENGTRYILGLCEGNHCTGGKKGRESGNGRIVVATPDLDSNGKEECSWRVEKVIKVPSDAYFEDYSGMAVRGDKMAILTQENSAVYIDKFDFDTLEFEGKGKLYHLPRDDECNYLFCNVEGIDWIDDNTLVLTSDKAKLDQPYSCTTYDQSIHVFGLPASD